MGSGENLSQTVAVVTFRYFAVRGLVPPKYVVYGRVRQFPSGEPTALGLTLSWTVTITFLVQTWFVAMVMAKTFFSRLPQKFIYSVSCSQRLVPWPLSGTAVVLKLWSLNIDDGLHTTLAKPHTGGTEPLFLGPWKLFIHITAHSCESLNSKGIMYAGDRLSQPD